MKEENVLNYYEALETASAEMLAAAKNGDWNRVVEIESACGLLIAQLKRASCRRVLTPEEERLKLRIMRRILRYDAEIRELAEPWLQHFDMALTDFPRVLH